MKPFAALLVCFLGACVSVPQNPPPTTIFVEFDLAAAPPVVPSPNDLAKDPVTGRIVVPPTPGESAAQREFELDYLGSLDGFPFESSAAAALSGDLDPNTVSTTSVLALDFGPAASPTAPVAVAITPTYVSANRTIVVPPPSGAWTRGHTYAIAFVGGPSGLRGANAQEVVGSEAWALVSSTTSLVTCQDLTDPVCRPTVDIIPSSETDPAARLLDQTTKARALEAVRRKYAPVLDAFAATGVVRTDIPIAWTFSIVDAGEVTFDPGNNIIPFPNDVLRPAGKVTLPNPKTFQPLTSNDCVAPVDPLIAITCGLNTLDGFSTLAPPVSENSDTQGAVAQAKIDPATLATTSVGLTPVATQAPSGESTQVHFTPCLNCMSSPDANNVPQTSPQQLQWKLDAPLDEKTTYLAYVTSGVKDDRGKAVIANPTFAMLRLANRLYDGTHATVNLLTDAQAQQLEPLRLAMKPLLDGMAQAGIARTQLALAFAFTTQSEASVLDQLYGYPYSPALSALPDVPLYLVDATAAYQARAAAGSIPFAAVGKVLVGALLTPVAITGPQGTLDVANPHIAPVPFVLYLPAAGAAPYPLSIFSHAFTRTRNDSIALANALASAGQATIAMDTLFHGERSSCTGSKAATGQATDDASCANPAKQKCNEDPLIGRCVARLDADRAACVFGNPLSDLGCTAQAQGYCVSDNKCEGGDFLRDATGRPVISGWNLLSLTNFFETRDNFRQSVIDLSQLVRVIDGQGAGSLSTLAGTSFDPAQLGYVGQNLGSILGALGNAVSPHTTHVALNTPGGALVQMILTAPAFATQKAALLATLASQGLQPGTPAFDQILGIAQWILDPADPMSVGYRMTHSVSVTQGTLTYTAPNPARKAFMQFIEGDLVVPNTSSYAFVAAANRSFSPTPPSFACVPPLYAYEFTEAGDAFDQTSIPLAARDPFLLQPAPSSAGLAVTGKAQLQVATFLAAGVVP